MRIAAELIDAPAQARRLYRRAPELDVSATAMQVLVLLIREQGAIAKDVEDALELEQSLVSHVVADLLKANLVTRERDESDRRRQLIHATRSGTDLVQRFIDEFVPPPGSSR
jgi:DNA-binding MarR family transcriptional regulator